MARDNRLWEKNNLNATQSGSRDEPTVIAAKYCYETYKLKITGHVRELAPTGGEDSGSTGEEMTFDIEGGTISKFCKCTSIDPTDPNAGSSSDSFKLGVGGSFTYEKTTRMLACGGLPCYVRLSNGEETSVDDCPCGFDCGPFRLFNKEGDAVPPSIHSHNIDPSIPDGHHIHANVPTVGTAGYDWSQTENAFSTLADYRLRELKDKIPCFKRGCEGDVVGPLGFTVGTDYVVLRENNSESDGSDHFRTIEPPSEYAKDPKGRVRRIYTSGQMKKPSWGPKQRRALKAYKLEYGIPESTRIYVVRSSGKTTRYYRV